MSLFSLFRRRKERSPIAQSVAPKTNKLTKSVLSKQDIYEGFEGCADIQTDEMTFGVDGSIQILLVYSEKLCNMAEVNKEILPSLSELLAAKRAYQLRPQTIIEEWHKPGLEIERDLDRLVSNVFEGQLVLFVEHLQTAYVLDVSDRPQRQLEEPNTEITIRGPRDGFIEDIEMNVALLRKRMRSNSLKYEQYILGERSQTKVGLLYVDDVIRPEILQEVKRRLDEIDIDTIITQDQLEEIMTESRYPLFPIFHYTGRPDFAMESLLNGRFIIFVDGLPTATIGPLNFIFLLKTGEDSSIHFLYNSFERLLRLVGMWVASSLPGFWVALTTYHQDQLPFILIATLSETRQGVPLPTPLEALIMVILFELFREAGIRLPMSIGQMVTVVGGLIIGDAAIRAGLTSPANVVVVAVSAVATFTLINQSLQGITSLFRIFILIFSSFLGIFGFLVSSFLILLYTANLRSFGLPYLAPLSPFHFRDFLYAVFRPSWKQRRQRPGMFQPRDSRRQEDTP